jgi:hypothetical protein
MGKDKRSPSILSNTFDWSKLDRYSIAEKIWEISPNIIHHLLSVIEFHSIITTHLKKHIPVRVRKTFNSKTSSNQIYIGGAYYIHFDQKQMKCIEVTFQYHEKDTIIVLTANRFWKICLLIADTILHEVIHMRQYRRRQFKIIPDYKSTSTKIKLQTDQAYLGCADEVDAYSFNIACELLYEFNGDQTAVVNCLNEDQPSRRRKKDSWHMYLKTFEHDHSHPIITRVKKTVIRYLPLSKKGKPYRDKNWISY